MANWILWGMPLVKAVQEQQIIIETQQEMIQFLTDQQSKLNERLEALEARLSP
jgi:hypothetical protein